MIDLMIAFSFIALIGVAGIACDLLLFFFYRLDGGRMSFRKWRK